MDPLKKGDILEIRSRESTVEEDLPAWCRMVRHEFLGKKENELGASYFVRKGESASTLDKDQEAAKGYRWTVRVQGEKGMQVKVFARNHSFQVGQPAEFSSKVTAPSATDYLLASLASCITVGFKSLASQNNIILDNTECTMNGKLDNVLYSLGVEDKGHPGFSKISGILYVSSPDDEEKLHRIFEKTLDRSPIYRTLKESININIKLSIIL
ncbi:osmotically inducible protein OsmC [Bacillus sp. PK3_68]|nr:osmotically inducible protein OsmC [Bacillus sp. PK3_68]